MAYKRYTSEEVDFIQKNYELKGPKYCSEKLGKSWSGVQKVGKRLGLKANNTFICNNSLASQEARKKQGNYLSDRFNSLILSNAQKLKIVKLYESGLSSIVLAKRYDCSKPVILRALKDVPKRKMGDYPQHFSKTQGHGASHHSWKGGYKSVYDRFRDLSRYYEWRTAVLQRDNNCCTKCDSEERLQSHHVITLKTLVDSYCNKNLIDIEHLEYNDLMSEYFYDLDNGLTLCEICHKQYHKECGRE